MKKGNRMGFLVRIAIVLWIIFAPWDCYIIGHTPGTENSTTILGIWAIGAIMCVIYMICSMSVLMLLGMILNWFISGNITWFIQFTEFEWVKNSKAQWIISTILILDCLVSFIDILIRGISTPKTFNDALFDLITSTIFTITLLIIYYGSKNTDSPAHAR